MNCLLLQDAGLHQVRQIYLHFKNLVLNLLSNKGNEEVYANDGALSIIAEVLQGNNPVMNAHVQ